jgi:hypothetical protein
MSLCCSKTVSFNIENIVSAWLAERRKYFMNKHFWLTGCKGCDQLTSFIVNAAVVAPKEIQQFINLFFDFCYFI